MASYKTNRWASWATFHGEGELNYDILRGLLHTCSKASFPALKRKASFERSTWCQNKHEHFVLETACSRDQQFDAYEVDSFHHQHRCVRLSVPVDLRYLGISSTNGGPTRNRAKRSNKHVCYTLFVRFTIAEVTSLSNKTSIPSSSSPVQCCLCLCVAQSSVRPCTYASPAIGRPMFFFSTVRQCAQADDRFAPLKNNLMARVKPSLQNMFTICRSLFPCHYRLGACCDVSKGNCLKAWSI